MFNGLKSATRKILSMLLNIFLALCIGSVFLLLQKQNPLEVFYYLLIEPLKTTEGLIIVLGKSVPYVFTGLACAITFRSGLFNIGVEGQMFWGALGAVIVGLTCKGLPPVLHVTLAIVAAMVFGGFWSFIAGWLKVRLKVNEVLSTIMMNYLAANLVSYLLLNYFRGDGPTARTADVLSTARLAQFWTPNQLNSGAFIAIAAVIGMVILLYFLPFGWQIDASGLNPTAAKYCGVNSSRVILLVMAISGMLAGLCGAERILGAFGYMDLKFSASYGLEGMVIAIIASNNPIAVVVISAFFGLLNYGGLTLNMMTSVPTEWTQCLIAIMLVLVAVQQGLKMRTKKRHASANNTKALEV